MKERNAFVIVIGGDEGVGNTLIKCMLQKNPGSYFMFAGLDMTKLRNALRKFRKLSFMSDINFIQLSSDDKSFLENRYYVKMAAVASKFECYTGMPLTELVLVCTNSTNNDPLKELDMNSSLSLYSQTTSIYLPILKAFYRLASRFSVDTTIISALYDLSDKPSSLSGQVEREILNGLMESSFRENRRDLRQVTLVILDGVEINANNKQESIKTGVGILDLIENHSIIGLAREHIGTWAQCVAKETTKTVEELSFAKKMYNLMVGKVSNFVQLESFIKKEATSGNKKAEKKIQRGILNYSLIDTNNNRWLNRARSITSKISSKTSLVTDESSSPIFFIAEEDNEEYSDDEEPSYPLEIRRHSTDFAGTHQRISGCRQLKNKTSREILEAKAPNVAKKIMRQNTIS